MGCLRVCDISSSSPNSSIPSHIPTFAHLAFSWEMRHLLVVHPKNIPHAHTFTHTHSAMWKMR